MHFFVDHDPAQLTSQVSSGDGFGPSSANPTNVYDVSANFQLASDAKAFACQAGHIIVTDFFDVGAGALDPALVNVVLKPMAALGVTFPTVKYYLYRGIKRDSFFTGANFNAEAAGNTDTVRTMWEDWHANAASNPVPLAPADLGFDAGLAGTVHIEEIFGNAQAPLRARQVREGEWIGTFASTKKICFEVIVEAELLTLDLDYARKSKAQVDVTNMTAVATPTPEQVHALRCEREKILAYVDPAALFGMHFSIGVSGAGLTAPAKGDTLVTTFLSRFSTATRVYLDIRSDKGYSYNFYGNYGGGGPNLIRIRPGASAAFADDPYVTQGWPLFSRDGWTGPGAKVNLGLRLRIDDNVKPLLFVEDVGHLSAGSKNFFDDTKLRDGTAVDWSKAVNLKLDGSGAAGAKVCVATQVRLQYFKQQTGAAVANPRLLTFNHRLDTVFGGVDLPIVGSVGAFRELRNEKVGLAEGARFAHVPDTGMYFDPSVALLYGSARAACRTNPRMYPDVDFAKSTLDNVVRSPVFPSDIVFSRWSIVEGGTTVRLVDLSLYKKGTKNTSKDGIYFLGLKRDELTRLQATAGFGPLHQRFLVFIEAADQLDDTGFPYKKYEVKVQGLDAAGQRTVVAPNPAVNVFGAGANMFCSSDFADLVNLPDVPPDPEEMTPWEHVFDGEYFFGDPDVTKVSTSGRVVVSDIGNSLEITSPTVRLRARYFFPVDANGDTTISGRRTSYPLVVIVHGNGQRYREYDMLAERLAHNGFIVASVNGLIALVQAKLTSAGSNLFMYISELLVVVYDHSSGQLTIDTGDGNGLTLQSWVKGTDFQIDLVSSVPDTITFLGKRPFELDGMAPHGRAEALAKHLEVLKHKFGAQVADNIGLIGHSRGGEAVVRAVDIIGASSALANLRQIKAIVSLAPTDYWEQVEVDLTQNLTQNIPYFVLYGSRDCDIDGARVTPRLYPGATDHGGSGGFSLYDRAINHTVKSMAFVYGANHNGFITRKDNEAEKRRLHGSAATSQPKDISTMATRTQRTTARAYMAAFLRRHLLGEEIWKGYFTGEFIPASIGDNAIYLQYKNMIPGESHMIDDFENAQNAPPNWAVSSSGQPVAHSRAGAGLTEGFLNPFAPTIDVDSPHQTNGLKVTGWTASDKLSFTVATGGLDVTAWTHVSFRITQVARRTNSPISTMKVALVDAHTPAHRHEVVLSRTVPEPHNRPDDPTLTKSAMMTVRIALADYQAQGVDLTKVQSVELVFPAVGPGNVELDDVEFTK